MTLPLSNARADVYVNEASYLWSPDRNEGAVADLKDRNPDIKVLGYVNAPDIQHHLVLDRYRPGPGMGYHLVGAQHARKVLRHHIIDVR